MASGAPVAPTQAAPYTLFTANHKTRLTILMASASLASTLTATSYLPLIPMLQKSYNVSAQAINLTLTVYSIVQSVTPAIFAPLSDTLGRRPISILTYLIYTVANLGMAINHSSYVGLILLRGLQAFGASACVSIAYGVIADVCVPSERGSMVGPVMSATNVGTFIGPVIGGIIAWRSRGQQWVFWALLIFGVLNIVLLVALLPETARVIVQNGSGHLKSPRDRPLRRFLRLGPNWILRTDNQELACEEATQRRPGSIWRNLPNPLACLTIALSRETALILWCGGVNYGLWYCIAALVPPVYSEKYGWNELEIGLAYLPGAAAIIAGGIINGKWMDYKYKKTAIETGFTIDKVKGDDLDKFPIEKARTRDLSLVWLVYVASLAGMGWAWQAGAHPAISLVLQALVGLLGTLMFFCLNTLLIDIHPERPSTAAAAATVVRCGLAAAGVAILEPLSSAVGRGWMFTIFTVVIGGSQGLGILVIQHRGWNWRRRHKTKRETSNVTDRA